MNEKAKDRVAQGIEFMSAMKYELARREFALALEEDRKYVDAYIHLGNACVNLEQHDEAIDAFGKALILDPDSQETRYSLGCVHFLKGDSVEALKYFNQCEEAGFALDEMYGLMELIFIDAEDYVQAIRCANKAIKLAPLRADYHIDKAQIYLLDGKPREALSVLQEVERLLPDAGETYLIEAQIYASNEEPEEALAVLERALARFSQDTAMMVMKARVLNDLGRFDESLAILEEAERVAADDSPAMREVNMVRSVALVGKGEVKSSIMTLEGVAATDPSDTDALFLLANECYAMEEYEKAERYSRQILDIDEAGPRYRASAIFWIAMSLSELGRKEEAEAAFVEATSTLRQISIGNPGLIEVYVYRALCNSALGRFEDAHDLIDHVIALLPDEAPGYAFKAQIADAQGDKEAAHKMRAKAKELDPDFEL